MKKNNWTVWLSCALIVALAFVGIYYANLGTLVYKDTQGGYGVYTRGFRANAQYIVRFKDISNRQAATLTLPTQALPQLRALDEYTIEALLPLGGEGRLCYYFDRKSGRLSEAYHAPSYAGEGVVILGEWHQGQGQLVVRDLFTGEMLYARTLNFSPYPMLAGSIISIELAGEGVYDVRYHSGEDFHEEYLQLVLPYKP